MSPDRAAELLQIPERGIELLQRFEEDENVRKAITAVQGGFAAADVAKMYGLEYEQREEEEEDLPPEGSIFIYECQTKRCRQKNRVATSSTGPDAKWDDPEEVQPPPNCPSCGQMMHYVMSVEEEMDIPTEFKRTFLPKSRFHDEMHGVDKTGASGRDIGDDE